MATIETPDAHGASVSGAGARQETEGLRMFVAYTSLNGVTSEDVGRFANSRTRPEAIAEAIGSPTEPHLNPLIADGRVFVVAGTLDASTSVSFLFFAKDRQTLKDGLKACPAEIKISGGTNNLGFFGKSYNFEKMGGWLRQRKQSTKRWNSFDAGQRDGMPRKVLQAFFNRFRLTERGYFILVGRSFVMPEDPDVTKLIGTEISLPGLGSLMSNRLTREQAVGNLMQDLLVA